MIFIQAGKTYTKTEGTVTEVFVPAKVNGVGYATFAEALVAANGMTGDVVVEINGKVEYTNDTPNLAGAYNSITFVGKTADARISITRNGANGYIPSAIAWDNGGYEVDNCRFQKGIGEELAEQYVQMLTELKG